MQLLTPDLDHLSEYIVALRQGWSPDTLRAEAGQEQLAKIAKDPQSFVNALDDPDAKAGPVTLPDGSQTARLPSIRRWIWADGFCGHIGLRWQKGTEALPATCSGHIGYGVVPWRQGEGLASAALRALLPVAAAKGLRYVEITTSPSNLPSIRVIEKAGGVLTRHYTAKKSLGGHEVLEFRVQSNFY